MDIFHILLSVLLIGTGSIIVYLKTEQRELRAQIRWHELATEQYQGWMDDIRHDVDKIRDHTARFDASPQFRGRLGEEVVSVLLDYLPTGSVTEQVSDSKIPGRPDFMIDLPTSPLKLIIDAKTIHVPEGSTPHSILLRKAKDITKYIVDGYTFGFVLMWIPEQVYYEMSEETYIQLYERNVYPVTTTNLMPIVQMVNRAYKVFKLNEEAAELADYQSWVNKKSDHALTVVDKATKQAEYALNNLKATRDNIERIKNRKKVTFNGHSGQ